MGLALSAVEGQPAADPWGFEEVAAETWADILRPQYLDYMGFAKSYLISITNIFSALDWNWPVPQYNIAWYLFFGFSVVSTILWGRLYCGRICAYGALTQTLDLILPARWRFEVPKAIEKRASFIKFGLLAALLGYYLLTHNLLIYQYVEPFWMFGLFGTTIMWSRWAGAFCSAASTVSPGCGMSSAQTL